MFRGLLVHAWGLSSCLVSISKSKEVRTEKMVTTPLKTQPCEAAPRGGQRLNLEKDIGNFNVPWPDAQWWGKLPPTIFDAKSDTFVFFGDFGACVFMSFCFNQESVVRMYRPGAQIVATFFSSTADGDIKILSPCLFLTVTFCFSSWGDLRLCQRHSKS